MSPLVTICIPVYNGIKYIDNCLTSVINQTYNNIEILIIDDGSTDGSVEYVKELQKTEQRIRLIINEKNLGLVGNWNKCISEAKGEWIKFLFQDDLMQGDCVKKMITACNRFNVNMAISSRNFLVEHTADPFLKDLFTNQVFRLDSMFPSLAKIKSEEIAQIIVNKLFQNIIGEPIVLLFKKDVIKKISNYNEDLVQLVDYEFVLRAALNFDVVFIPENLVSFRVHSSSATNKRFDTELKSIKINIVEPMVMYHEFLFNRNFKLLRKKKSFLNILKEAISFYSRHKKLYKIPASLEKEIFYSYKGLYLIKFLQPIYLINKQLKSLIKIANH
jgi:glycosyltransferase involved in cell wall biosynthesis